MPLPASSVSLRRIAPFGLEVVVEGGRTGAVMVALGPSPDPAGHRRVGSIPAGGGRLVVDLDPEAGRPYVSLTDGAATSVVAERRLDFDGPTNFRDLGGYATEDGGTTTWGVLFRSDGLQGLSARDLAYLSVLGIETIFDLRTAAEQDRYPDPVPARRVPLFDVYSAEDLEALGKWQSRSDGEQRLRDLYLGMLEHAAEKIGTILSEMAAPGGLPAVVHCMGGKDRTGLVAALVLVLAGVSTETVLDDYELTRRYRPIRDDDDFLVFLRSLGVGHDAAVGLLDAPRWAMAEALSALEHRYGGVRNYLIETAGMEPGALARLHTALVTAP